MAYSPRGFIKLYLMKVSLTIDQLFATRPWMCSWQLFHQWRNFLVLRNMIYHHHLSSSQMDPTLSHFNTANIFTTNSKKSILTLTYNLHFDRQSHLHHIACVSFWYMHFLSFYAWYMSQTSQLLQFKRLLFPLLLLLMLLVKLLLPVMIGWWQQQLKLFIMDLIPHW